jgi:hypothetical protein
MAELDQHESTTQQLIRVVEQSRQLTETRINGMEKLQDEKFKGLQEQLREMSERNTQHFLDKKESVNIAFTAAKELVNAQNASATQANNKFELSIKEQLVQIVVNNQLSSTNLSDKIDVLSSRQQVTDGQQMGNKANKDDNKVFYGLIIAAVSLFVTVYLNLHAAPV